MFFQFVRNAAIFSDRQKKLFTHLMSKVEFYAIAQSADSLSVKYW
ncbi:MAG: hypothetical protein PUP91_15465 [Rhizonema sp. PD37]|nr:hypothetical protein [Rhizonema sp. PD37]